MSMCSTGDAFEVYTTYEGDGVSLSGCYKDSGETEHDVIRYSLDGITFRDTAVAPDVPIAYTGYVIGTWYVGIQRQGYEVGTMSIGLCRDVELRDSSTTTMHPWEVSEWECYDYATGNYTLEDSMTTTCGCSTPQPSVAPPPSPEPEPMTTCSSGDAFFVATDVTEDGHSLSGCFEDTDDTPIDGPAYYEGTIERPRGESALVYTVDIFQDFPVWVLGMERHDFGSVMPIATCSDADYQNASTIHPTEVGRWNCYDSYDGPLENPVTMTCGCDTFAPSSAPDGTFAPTALGTRGPSQGPTEGRTEGRTESPAALTPGQLRRLGETSALPNSATGDGGALMLAGALGGAFVVCGLFIGLLLKTGRLKTLFRGTSSGPVSG